MTTGSDTMLYPRLLGADWEELHERLRRFHSVGRVQGAGVFRIQRGRGALARLIAGLLRFPRAGDAVPTRLLIHTERYSGVACEIWQRTFGEQKLISRQYANRDGLLAERFGCLELRFRLKADGDELLFQPAGSSLAVGGLQISLAGRLSPRVDARVSAADCTADRITVKVEVSAPLVGTLLHYEGNLNIEGSQP